MRIHRGIDELAPKDFRDPVATIGVFDGVHRGHRHLVDGVQEWARATGGESVVVTFDRHPRAVLGQRPPAMLQSLEHRLVLLERTGIEAVVVLAFDAVLAALEAEAFCRSVLVERMGCRRLLMGFDSAFGRGARGTAESLSALPDLGIEVRRHDSLLVDDRPISSTQAREAILRGELVRAEEMLGRSVSIYGEVIHGDGRGRELGFPTANLNLFHSAAPPHGVYIATTEIEGVERGCLVNIGRRPTFMRPDDPAEYSRYYNEQLDKIEVYVHADDVGDLYGRRLEVVFREKVRDERRFGSVDELVAQIRRDVTALEEWLAAR